MILVVIFDELDKLFEFLYGGCMLVVGELEGEYLFVIERLVVSPVVGVFVLFGLGDGTRIEVGDVLGIVVG